MEGSAFLVLLILLWTWTKTKQVTLEDRAIWLIYVSSDGGTSLNLRIENNRRIVANRNFSGFIQVSLTASLRAIALLTGVTVRLQNYQRQQRNALLTARPVPIQQVPY